MSPCGLAKRTCSSAVTRSCSSPRSMLSSSRASSTCRNSTLRAPRPATMMPVSSSRASWGASFPRRAAAALAGVGAPAARYPLLVLAASCFWANDFAAAAVSKLFSCTWPGVPMRPKRTCTFFARTSTSQKLLDLASVYSNLSFIADPSMCGSARRSLPGAALVLDSGVGRARNTLGPELPPYSVPTVRNEAEQADVTRERRGAGESGPAIRPARWCRPAEPCARASRSRSCASALGTRAADRRS